MAYSGVSRKLILAFKHGDRLDLVRPMGEWMARVAEPMMQADTVLVPVPLHYKRLLRRRYNQAACLARAVAVKCSAETLPDLLIRKHATPPQAGMTQEERFQNVADAIGPSRHARQRLGGRPVLLVDDVMTSGATLAAAADACHAIGASRVDVLALARAVKDA